MRTTRLLTVSQHALWPGGTRLAGGGTCLGRGCTCPGGCTCRRLPAWQGAGCTCPGGTCPGTPPPLWTDRHLWKHNLRKLRLGAVTIQKMPEADPELQVEGCQPCRRDGNPILWSVWRCVSTKFSNVLWCRSTTGSLGSQSLAS